MRWFTLLRKFFLEKIMLWLRYFQLSVTVAGTALLTRHYHCVLISCLTRRLARASLRCLVTKPSLG